MKKILILAFFLLALGEASAADFNKIIAYPVPFHTHRHNYVTVGFGAPETPIGSLDVDFSVYDINGDSVFRRSYSGLPITWNGRNGAGKTVKPGLYILKLKIEDMGNGAFASKIIRILVDY